MLFWVKNVLDFWYDYRVSKKVMKRYLEYCFEKDCYDYAACLCRLVYVISLKFGGIDLGTNLTKYFVVIELSFYWNREFYSSQCLYFCQ